MVGHTLEQIKLSHVKDTFVRNLSGGQRKRVSIGVELLADPKLFFWMNLHLDSILVLTKR
jgi:ABC-type multidrug transport system ATPase subunit